MRHSKQNSAKALASFVLQNRLFALGTFEAGITIYTQQVRALNLAWAMTSELNRDALSDIAIIGGGFAGITIAAALAKKGIPRITLFEKRPVLLPLQEGSDTRWVHPHIYNWPSPESETPNASLPIINWSAGRASDVAAHVSRAWDELKAEVKNRKETIVQITEKLGAQYIQIEPHRKVTWTSTALGKDGSGARQFSAIVLAMGFGEEKSTKGTNSYWRNESLGQPALTPGVRTYLISGYGDGALVDLCRIRLSQFRQDRIIDELFDPFPELLKEIRAAYSSRAAKRSHETERTLNEICSRNPDAELALTNTIRSRLRKDTAAILQVNAGSLRDVYEYKSSIQNRLLFYFLFKAGAFIPSHKEVEKLVSEYAISPENILLRHGTHRLDNVQSVLSPSSYSYLKKKLVRSQSKGMAQTTDICWPGGYWDQIDKKFHLKPSELEKSSWRQEYLPVATELMASTFCSSVAAIIARSAGASDFRVTLHRSIAVGNRVWLQQSCRYFGNTKRGGLPGRTFSTQQGIIGLAFHRKSVCRSEYKRKGDIAHELVGDAKTLAVGTDAQTMSPDVRSLLAIPMTANGTTCLVLFADSTNANVFEDRVVSLIIACATSYFEFIAHPASIEGVRNFPFHAASSHRGFAIRKKLKAIRVVRRSLHRPPSVSQDFQFNFEMENT